MSTAREIAQRFFDLINMGRASEVFGLLGPTSKYTVIGKTAISRTYHGKKDIDDNMLPVLASFKDGPNITCHVVIADGDRAVVLASGTGTGPTGDYDQPYYAWSFEVRNGELYEMIEYLDTSTLETGVLGKKLVDA